ncbi:beta-lactamase family protein [Porticoccaceae bacterium]|nr:beta-lactamase family protein [Porticoccaceae bacterium]
MPATTDHATEISNLEKSIKSPLQFNGIDNPNVTLLERMAHFKVPGVSIALIDQGEIAWAKSWGVKNTADEDVETAQVNTNTLFQAASISKLLTSLGAMKLVESGKLSLDQPINSSLTRWKLPNNEFTRQVPVTLTHLLSHTAGTTVHGFRGYAQSEPQPTAIEILNGDEIANSSPVVVDTLPGTNFRYSGGGTTIAQIAMEDVAQQTFTQLMDRLILKPTAMTSSTFEQPLPDSDKNNVACGHLGSGELVSGLWHNYPIQAAASLWTTPTDLAKCSLAITKSWRGEEGALLSKKLCDQYLGERLSGWGLGPQLFIEDGKTIGFQHGGANEGYRCNSLAFLDGRGAVVMTNSDEGDALLAEIMTSLAELYDWPVNRVKAKDFLEIAKADRALLAGVYSLTDEDDGKTYDVNVQLADKGLSVRSPWFESARTFYMTSREDGVLTFTDAAGWIFTHNLSDKNQAVITLLGNKFIK